MKLHAVLCANSRDSARRFVSAGNMNFHPILASRSTGSRRYVAYLILLVFPHLCWSQQPATLTVSGNVAASAVLNLEQLRGLSPSAIVDTRAGSEQNKDKGASRTYVGVLLRDILKEARITEPEPRGLRKSIVIVNARDGYRVIFSWAELYLTPIGDGVYVAYERDGAPLPPSEGPLALISLADTSPGPRHVKWLQGIEIRMVGD
jgi:DMSO/TMAO reductase YedYZ molybdopterin-dependent catalytic subunit